MIRSRLAAGCRLAILDALTNQVTLVGILDDIVASGFPVVLPRYTIVFLLDRDPNDPPVPTGVTTIWLGQKKVAESELAADFEDKLHTRAFLTIQGFPVPEPGILRVALSIEGREVASFETHIRLGAPLVVRQAALPRDAGGPVVPPTEVSVPGSLR